MNKDISIQEISDREQIRDLLILYCTAVDAKNYDLLDTCFTKDAKIDMSKMNGPVGGYPEFRAWLESSLNYLDSMQHSVSNFAIEIEGDMARGRTMFANINVMKKPDGSNLIFRVGGYYNDEFVRTSEGWKFSYRAEEEPAYFDGEVPSRETLAAQDQ